MHQFLPVAGYLIRRKSRHLLHPAVNSYSERKLTCERHSVCHFHSSSSPHLSRIPSAYILPSVWKTKFHTHVNEAPSNGEITGCGDIQFQGKRNILSSFYNPPNTPRCLTKVTIVIWRQQNSNAACYVWFVTGCQSCDIKNSRRPNRTRQ